MRPAAAILLLAVIVSGVGVDAGAASADAPSAQAIAERGVAAMRDSFQRPVAIIDAAIAFSEARKLYQASADVDHICEMQAYLFWCKKRMNLDDLRSYVGAKDQERLNQALAAVEVAVGQPVASSEAQAYFDRAQAFAQKNPDRHLEIAVRFFEIAERFAGTDLSLKSQRLSLDEQQKHLSSVEAAKSAAVALPAPWQHQDVGPVKAAGAASYSGGVFTVSGAGSDIWNASDRFHFAYQPLRGDGMVTARLLSFKPVDPATKVGVMIRQDLTEGSPNAMVDLIGPGNASFQRRAAPGGATVHAAAPITCPCWLRLIRLGGVVMGVYSSDGLSWRALGCDTVAMTPDALAGLAVTAHHDGAMNTATFSDVVAAPVAPLPSPWRQGDIGPVGAPGAAVGEGRLLAMTGSGADIWGSRDACRFVWRPQVGDGALTARLPSRLKSDEWERVGLMIRADCTPTSANAFVCLSFNDKNASALQTRPSDGAETAVVKVVPGVGARWVRLERAGDTITGSVSTDGTAWTELGTATLALPRTACIGFAVCSHHDGQLGAAVFTDIEPAFAPVAAAAMAGAGPHPTIPDADATRAAAEHIRQALKVDYAKTAKKDRRALSARLLSQARATSGDPVMRWAFLSEAVEQAIAAADPDAACAPIDAAPEWFSNVDLPGLKKAALARIGGALASAMTKLIDSPTNPDACAVAGRHLCFDRDRWDEGARLLANIADRDLRRAAELELSAPTDPSQQSEVADAWRAASAKQPAAQRAAPLARAQWWYLRALPQLSGMTLEIAAKRLGEIADALPDERLDPRAMPKKRWDAIKAKPLMIQGNSDRMDTGVVLAPGQTALVFPQPGGSWSAGDTATEARGVPGAKLNGFAPGELLWSIDTGPRETIWSGPCLGAGHLMLGANRAKDGGKGGAIPVKILVIDED